MNNDYALPGLQTAYQDGSEDTTALINEVLDAHGGLTQWKRFTKISATIRLRRNSTAPTLSAHPAKRSDRRSNLRNRVPRSWRLRT
jgi:hypothetical protein